MRTRLLILLLGTLTFASAASGQATNAKAAKTGALAGTITDSAGTPLSNASVLALGLDLVAVTDDSGRFHLGGVPAGEAAFTVVKLGFKPVTFETTLLADTTLVVAVRLRATARDSSGIRERSRRR